MNIFEEYLDKIKKVLLDLSKNGEINAFDFDWIS